MARSRRFSKAPFVWLVAVAILIELALIPVFLLTGADAVLGDALDAAGIAFNTDLVTATRIMFIEPNTIGPVLSIVGFVVFVVVGYVFLGCVVFVVGVGGAAGKRDSCEECGGDSMGGFH